MANQRYLSSHLLRTALAPACLAGLVLIAGCSSDTPEQRIAKAREAYQQHNYHAAEVQLKTVLSKHGDNGKAWALLGQTSMAERQYDNAIHQFRKAKAAGQPTSALALPLGRALVATGQYQPALDVLDTDAGASDQVRAMITAARGDAYTGLEQSDQAAQAYAAALAIDPKLSDALRGQARLAIQRGDLASARETLGKAVAAHPDDANSLVLLGQIDYRAQSCDAATEHLSHALDTGGGILTGAQAQTSRAILAECHLRNGKIDAAQQNIDAILAAEQNNPVGNYLQALMDIRQGDYQQAANHVQATLNADPQNLRSMTLMAWIRIAQGRPDAAQPFLSRVLERAPDNVAALRLQAGLWMAQNQNEQARDLIQQAAERHPDQPALRDVLAQVVDQLKNKRADGAGEGGSGAIDDVSVQLGLARSLAQMGSQSAAQTILGKIQAKTPAQKRELEIARIRIALDSGNASVALEHAKDLVAQNPSDPEATQLLASSYVAAGQYDAADKVLAKAQPTKPQKSDPIVHARVQLAVQQHDYAKAIKLLKPIQESNPDETDVTIALASLYQRAGQGDQSIALLNHAANVQAGAPQLQKALARAYMSSGQTDKAMQLIDSQLKGHNNDADWLQLKGVGQLVRGETDAGIQTLGRAADQAPDQPQLALDVAKAQLSSGRTDKAIERLQRLRKQSPDFLPAAGFLALAQAAAGDTDAALKQVGALRRNGQKHQADVLEGDVLSQAKRYKKANAAYGHAFDAQPSARLALAMFNVRRAGNLASPAEPLQTWLSQNPDDSAVELQLANWYQANDQNDKAAAVYQKVLSKDGKTVIALNNLAMIQADTAPRQALDYARRAHEQAPGSPAVADTLGWLLVKNDQLDQGIDQLEKAEKKAGSASPEIRYHLGAALARRGGSGDRKQAKTLLTQALSAGLSGSEASQAHKILEQMAKNQSGAADNSS